MARRLLGDRQTAALSKQPNPRPFGPILCILGPGKGKALPELGTNWGTKRRAGTNVLPLVSLVCLILLALLAVAQVTHLHTSDSDADHCPICIMMHSAAPVTVAAAIVVLVQVGRQTLPAEECRAVRYLHPTLYIRPPPIGLQG
jgi:hypothetical protein